MSTGKKSREEIARAYASTPWWYDIRGFFILTFAYRSTLGFQLRFFGNNIGARHLEVAIGSGSLLDLVLRWRRWKRLPKASIVGIDYAQPMLEGAIARFAKQPEISLEHGDVAEMPFPDGVFDSANVANAVHCFPQVDAAFRGIIRVLKPGGRMAANVLLYPRGPRVLRPLAQKINEWGMRKGILFTPYEEADVRNRIVRAGFKIVGEVRSGNTYNVIAERPPLIHDDQRAQLH